MGRAWTFEITQPGQCNPRLLREQIKALYPHLQGQHKPDGEWTDTHQMTVHNDKPQNTFTVGWATTDPTNAQMQAVIDAHDPNDPSISDTLNQETKDAEQWLRQQYATTPDTPIPISARRLIALLGLPRN